MPTEILPYLYPSRYCEPVQFQKLANQTFGHMPLGYPRVDAIRNGGPGRTQFISGSSAAITKTNLAESFTFIFIGCNQLLVFLKKGRLSFSGVNNRP